VAYFASACVNTYVEKLSCIDLYVRPKLKKKMFFKLNNSNSKLA